MGNSTVKRMEEAVADLRSFTGGGYADVLQLVVTTVCVLVLIKQWWSWHLQGLKSIPTKGSFGWPIIGETLSVLRCGSNYPLEKWLAERIRRYGTIFKTYLFLAPSVVLTSPEELKFLFDDPHRDLNSGAPWALVQVFGPASVIALNGKEHTDMHKLLADSLLLPELKRKIPEMDRIMRHTMNTWTGNIVELTGTLQEMLLKIMTLNFFGIPWEDKLADRVVALLLPAVLGITSIPIYIPGTGYFKARNARKKLNELLLPIIRELRNPQAGGSSKYAKLESFPYRNLLECEMYGEKITDIGVCDVLVGTILSGIHTPTNTTAIAIKYLTENPSFLQKVQAETEQLQKKKEEAGETVFSSSDLKELKYTIQVYHEVLRISSITPGVARTAKSDIDINGYVIPKGWTAFAALTPIHMDPETYPEPWKFNPDRFERPPNPRKFLPFGRGRRACVGRDITKLLVVMSLYHITTRFTWKIVSSGGIITHLPIARMSGRFELAFKARTESFSINRPGNEQISI